MEMMRVLPHPLPPLTLPRRCKQTTTDKEQDRAAAAARAEGKGVEGEDPDVECEYMQSELVPMLKLSVNSLNGLGTMEEERVVVSREVHAVHYSRLYSLRLPWLFLRSF